jgi:predicted permease
MHGLLSDLRFGVRMLLKRPGTTTLAIAALGLGIGLTTTMFSIVNGAILRGLPFDESERILHVERMNPTQGNSTFEVSGHDFLDYRSRQQSFSDFVAFARNSAVVSGEGLNADRYRGVRMSIGTLRLLRVAPIKGRDFNEADEKPGAPAVMIISHRIWDTQFQQDPAAVGKVFRVNGIPTEIIGIMPPKFAFPVSEDLWQPLQLTLAPKRGEGQTFEVIGRLKPGVTKARASSDMAAVAAQLASQYPENKNITTEVKSYIEEFIGRDVIATLFTMLGAVFGVLLIACANVTNLQLARALERAREIAIRAAIGAERWRIVRQLLVEGLLLSAGGAALGVFIGWTGVSLFNAGIGDTNPPFWIDIRIDGTVLLFVTALAAAAAILSTLLPALRVTRGGAGDVLKDQGRGTTSLRTGLLSRVLVGFAVTLSCALLLVSGLMIKSVVEIGRIAYAFTPGPVLIARTTLESEKYATDGVLINMSERLLATLRTIPGVTGASVATAEPGQGGQFYLTREGEPFPPPDDGPGVRRIAAMPSYFDVLKLGATRGRVLNEQDRAGSAPVVVITQDFADRYFPGKDPLGKRVRLGRNPAWPWWTIVGVVPTLFSADSGDNVRETAFVPFAQAPDRNLTFLLAAGETPMAVAQTVRQAVRNIDQDLPLFQVDSFAAMLHRRSWAFRVFGSLFMSFGLSALVMAAAGLYGVLAFGVRLRTQEIGVRMALGADRRQVVNMIIRQGMIVVGVGVVIGFGLGALLGPAMSELFFNVNPRDPMVFAITAVVLIATGLVASMVPARKAASVDPLVALRQD